MFKIRSKIKKKLFHKLVKLTKFQNFQCSRVPTSSYQALLAASAAASTSAGPTDYSNVASTSKASPQPKPTAQKSQKSAKFPCNWVDSDVPCGKVFDEENELASHVKVSSFASFSNIYLTMG